MKHNDRLKQMIDARKRLAKERKVLKKELELKRQLKKQHKEISELKEQLHPTAKRKLQKFLTTTSKVMEQLGKGMQSFGTTRVKKPKVRIVKATSKKEPRSLLDRL